MCVVLGFSVIGRGEVQDTVAILGTHISLGGRAGEEEEEEGEKGEDGGEKEEDGERKRRTEREGGGRGEKEEEEEEDLTLEDLLCARHCFDHF